MSDLKGRKKHCLKALVRNVFLDKREVFTAHLLQTTSDKGNKKHGNFMKTKNVRCLKLSVIELKLYFN